MTILDGILILGLTLVIFGIFLGVFSYFFYTGGRQEGVIHSPYQGNIHVEQEEPGLPHYLNRAIYGAALTAIGLTVSGLSVAVKYVGKKKDSDSV